MSDADKVTRRVPFSRSQFKPKYIHHRLHLTL